MKLVGLILLVLHTCVFADSGRHWEWIGPAAPIVLQIAADRCAPSRWFVVVENGARRDGTLYRTNNFFQDWQPTHLHGVFQVLVHPLTGEVFALANSPDYSFTQLWHSGDHGKTFLLRENFHLRRVFLHPGNPRFLYGFGFGVRDLAISTDGGFNWTGAGGFPFPIGSLVQGGKVGDYQFQDLVVSPFKAGTLYVTGYFEIYYDRGYATQDITMVSRDGGRTWKSAEPFLSSFSTDAAFPGRAFGSSQGLYTLTKGGWELLASLTPGEQILSVPGNANELLTLHRDSNGKQTVFRSHDGGKTWRATSFNLRNTITAMVSTGGREGGLLAGTEGGGLYYRENGSGWRTVSQGIHQSNIEDIVFSNQYLYSIATSAHCCGFLPFLFSSRDQGRTWRDLSLRLPQTPPFFSIGVNPADPANIVLSGHGLWLSTDAGESWKRGAQSGETFFTCFDPRDPKTIYFRPPAWNAPAVYKSVDGGISVRRLPLRFSGKPVSSVNRVVVDPNDNRNVFVLTDGGLFKSVDGGETMTDISGPLRQPLGLSNDQSPDLADMAVLQPPGTFLLLDSYGSILHTNDGGAHWQLINKLRSYADRILPADSVGMDFWVSGGALLETKDGGKTWIDVHQELGPRFTDASTGAYVSAMSDPRSHPIYLATSYGVFKEIIP